MLKILILTLMIGFGSFFDTTLAGEKSAIQDAEPVTPGAEASTYTVF